MSLVNNARHSIGLMSQTFFVEEVTTTQQIALGTNQLGQKARVPIGPMPAKGPAPMSGETWLISKNLNGVWIFAAILNNPGPPVITGSRSGGEALTSLLTQLAAIGIIKNTTTP
jgi:hypothetical protein